MNPHRGFFFLSNLPLHIYTYTHARPVPPFGGYGTPHDAKGIVPDGLWQQQAPLVLVLVTKPLV